MAYQPNPFLERMSERTTSDQEFARLFSPKILQRLEDDVLGGAVHIFRSPPGAGKTTLLRAFTPPALRAFWNTRHVEGMTEAYQGLVAREVLHEQDGPQMLGVLLSCASGYADLPPGATSLQEGIFRALLDCRIVLRTLRSLASLLGVESVDHLNDVRLEYDEVGRDLKIIPLASSARELVTWAEQRERQIYVQLDFMDEAANQAAPAHPRFEGVLWLQSVRFLHGQKVVAPKRLLMIDDLHKLRRKQRAFLIDELTAMRPRMAVWLAERTIALSDELLSQGVRHGRELREYSLDDLWSGNRAQFSSFAQNILERRLARQNAIPAGSFAQYMREHLAQDDIREEVAKNLAVLRRELARHSSNSRYATWLKEVEPLLENPDSEALKELYVTHILLMRDKSKRQTTLDFGPLTSADFENRESSNVQGAAEIFAHEHLGIPYYFGIERLCVLSTSNVEELLSLAAALYEGVQAKQMLKKPELILSPKDQEKILREVAKHKRDFIPKNHTQGTRAQRMLDAIGAFCRAKTFLPNAPYAPGVTGIRLSEVELAKIRSNEAAERKKVLARVLSESVAENLLVSHFSSASSSRKSGTIFYLNRSLCAHYGLPLQMGGWQDISVEELSEWMESEQPVVKHKLLEMR